MKGGGQPFYEVGCQAPLFDLLSWAYKFMERCIEPAPCVEIVLIGYGAIPPVENRVPCFTLVRANGLIEIRLLMDQVEATNWLSVHLLSVSVVVPKHQILNAHQAPVEHFRNGPIFAAGRLLGSNPRAVTGQFHRFDLRRGLGQSFVRATPWSARLRESHRYAGIATVRPPVFWQAPRCRCVAIACRLPRTSPETIL